MAGLTIQQIEGIPAREVRPQRHRDGKKAAVHIRTIEVTDERRVLYTRYDPELVLEPHAHGGDEIIIVIEGELSIGEKHCKAPAAIILKKGTPFGPLIAGKKGTTIIEVFLGKDASMPINTKPEWFTQILKEKGITLLPEPDPATPPAAAR